MTVACIERKIGFLVRGAAVHRRGGHESVSGNSESHSPVLMVDEPVACMTVESSYPPIDWAEQI